MIQLQWHHHLLSTEDSKLIHIIWTLLMSLFDQHVFNLPSNEDSMITTISRVISTATWDWMTNLSVGDNGENGQMNATF